MAQSGREFIGCVESYHTAQCRTVWQRVLNMLPNTFSLSAVGTTAVQYPKRRVCVQAGGKITSNRSLNRADKQKSTQD